MFEITIRDLDDPKDVSTFKTKCLIYAALDEEGDGVNSGNRVRKCNVLQAAITVHGVGKACDQLQEKFPDIRKALKLVKAAETIEETEEDGGDN